MLLSQFPPLQQVYEFTSAKKVPVYLVGGFLRDHLLNREGMDFDFAVDGDALQLGKAFAKKIRGAYVLLDQDEGSCRVVKKSGGNIVTYDFSRLRAKTIKEDLKHRDFGINTFCVPLKGLKEADSLDQLWLQSPQALKDLKAKTIRMVSPRAFKEDPLRLLRAYSLKAQLKFKIEASTLKQIKKDAALLRQVSYERIREELFKVLEEDGAYAIIKEMDSIGLLQGIIPQLSVMVGVKQGGYHHLDVWKHSLEVLKQMEIVFDEFKEDDRVMSYVREIVGGGHSRLALMKLVCLLHDIGKPATRQIKGDRMTFYGHDYVGQKITRAVAKLLRLSVKERYVLEDLVRWHLRPGYLSNFKNPTEKSIFRYFRDTKDEAVSILLFSLADQRGTRGPLTTEYDQKHHQKICLGLLKRHFEKKDEKPLKRLIGGNDLIRKLKLTPSPLFGKILSSIEEQQALGKVTTKEEALELARKIAAKEARK